MIPYRPYLAAVLIAVAVLGFGMLGRSDDVVPASIAITNYRDATSIVQPLDTTFFENSSILFTNCVMYAGANTNSARQGLSNVTINVRLGNQSASTAYTGHALVATSGTWYCVGAVPTNMDYFYVQVQIVDPSTNSYTYEWQKLLTREPLD